ncbi:hypothetical protein D9613_003247 [Agrocybe pediades]|uniref:Uncharacterized protein n=1 Tax=Agrocybe pediades TaxID=84607 RepID=A0A8H4QRB7_9AGAR|nr:hypothetical protein D9613_003247 [Agrocybe pediades]
MFLRLDSDTLPIAHHPTTNYCMSSDSTSSLCSLTRSKLHLSISSKDGSSLHRWVLLKNSILNSPSLTESIALPSQPEPHPEEGDEDEEVLGLGDTDAFMFPDAGQLVGVSVSADTKSSEAQWLDSLLETLGDDDDDDYYVDSDPTPTSLPVDDDELQLYSPTSSPMSSSDDLSNQSDYYSSISVSYPVPYPPYQSPIIHAYSFDSHFEPLVSSVPVSPPYENPFPYQDTDDLEDLPVPDAIDDTSDDESDALTTPSLGRSSSSLSLVDAASIPLPQERSRLRHANPRVYVDSPDSYFYSFEIDPLPFPDDDQVHTPYNHYQEC